MGQVLSYPSPPPARTVSARQHKEIQQMDIEAAFAETGYDPEIEELLNMSCLPSILLGDDSSTTLTGQSRSELFSGDFSQHTEERDLQGHSREFLLGLEGCSRSESMESSLTETGYNTMMEQLLDRSSLSRVSLEEETSTTVGTEPFSEGFSLDSTFEDDSEEVNSQEFLEGLMSSSDRKPEGGRTSSRKSLLNGTPVKCDEAAIEEAAKEEVSMEEVVLEAAREAAAMEEVAMEAAREEAAIKFFLAEGGYEERRGKSVWKRKLTPAEDRAIATYMSNERRLRQGAGNTRWRRGADCRLGRFIVKE